LRYAFKFNKISYIYSFSFHFSIEKKGIFREKIVRVDDNVLIKIGHVNYIKIWIGIALHPDSRLHPYPYFCTQIQYSKKLTYLIFIIWNFNFA